MIQRIIWERKKQQKKTILYIKLVLNMSLWRTYTKYKIIQQK